MVVAGSWLCFPFSGSTTLVLDCSGYGGPLSVGARLSVLGPGALCVGARRSLHRGPLLLVSGPGALCRESASEPGGPLPRLYFPGTDGLCVEAQRSVRRGPAGPTRCLSGPGALCVGARRGDRCSLCRARRSVSGPGALCVRARRSVCRPALFVSGAGALRVGAGALFLSGSGALCQGVFGAWIVSVSELGALQRSLRGPSLSGDLCRDPALCVGMCVGAAVFDGVGDWVPVSVRLRRSLCRARRSVSGPGAPCVGARRSLCRGPGGPLPRLPLSRPSGLCVAPRAFCVGARRFVSGHAALSLCRGPALFVWARREERGPALFLSGSGALCRKLRAPSSHLRATHPAPICLPPSRHRAPSSDPCATHPARTPSSHPRATHPARRVLFSRRESQTLLFGGLGTYQKWVLVGQGWHSELLLLFLQTKPSPIHAVSALAVRRQTWGPMLNSGP